MDFSGEKRIIEKLDSDLRVAYMELGKKYYDENKAKNTVEESYLELLNKVKDVFAEKDKLEIRMLAKQGKRRCGKCQVVVSLESKFCNMCGDKLTDLSDEVLKYEITIRQRRCLKCGLALETEAVFCPECGQKNA